MKSKTALIVLLAALTLSCVASAETFDIVTYTPPPGWQTDVQGNHVVILRMEQNRFCLISIYQSAPAGESFAKNFLDLWSDILGAGFHVDHPQETAERHVGAAKAAWGSATVIQNGTPVYAQLFVADAGSRVVPIVVMTLNREEYRNYRMWIDPMFDGMSFAPVAQQSAPPSLPIQNPTFRDGRLEVPSLRRAVTLADLAGEWNRDDSVVTNYVNYRGDFAGYRSISIREKWTFDGKDGVSKSAFGVAMGMGGRQVADENTTGTVVLSNVLLTLRWKVGATATYIIRGWLELPEITIMLLNGPYWSTDVPRDVLNDRHIGANLDTYWTRKR